MRTDLSRTEDGLEQDSGGLEQESDGLEQDPGGLEQDSEGLEQDSEGLEQDSDGPEQDSEGLEQDSDGLEQDSAGLEQDSDGSEPDGGGRRQTPRRTLADGGRTLFETGRPQTDGAGRPRTKPKSSSQVPSAGQQPAAGSLHRLLRISTQNKLVGDTLARHRQNKVICTAATRSNKGAASRSPTASCPSRRQEHE